MFGVDRVLENRTGRNMRWKELADVKAIVPSLYQKEDAQTFFNKMFSDKQTHCGPERLCVICATQTKEAKKIFYEKYKINIL